MLPGLWGWSTLTCSGLRGSVAGGEPLPATSFAPTCRNLPTACRSDGIRTLFLLDGDWGTRGDSVPAGSIWSSRPRTDCARRPQIFPRCLVSNVLASFAVNMRVLVFAYTRVSCAPRSRSRYVTRARVLVHALELFSRPHDGWLDGLNLGEPFISPCGACAYMSCGGAFWACAKRVGQRGRGITLRATVITCPGYTMSELMSSDIGKRFRTHIVQMSRL